MTDQMRLTEIILKDVSYQVILSLPLAIMPVQFSVIFELALSLGNLIPRLNFPLILLMVFCFLTSPSNNMSFDTV